MTGECKNSSDSATAVANYLCACLLGLIFLPSFIFVLELFANNTAFKWQLPVIAGAAVPLVSLVFLRGHGTCIKVIALFLLACGVAKALFIASLFYDTTSDSSAYHADAILQILKGVNPLYQWMHGFDDVWVNHYPKVTWYFASIVIALTGNYNFGKIYNLLLIYAVAAYVFSFLKHRQFSTGNALLVGVAAAVNPVAIYQLHTFYVDGALASLTTLLLFSGLGMLKKSRAIDRAVFVMAACLLINIKFTGAAAVFLLCAICVIYVLYAWKKKHGEETGKACEGLAKSIALVALVGGLIMGFNPYISNIMEEGTPLYPLFGKIKYDVVPAQSPKSFNDNQTSTLGKLAISVFSQTKNIVYQHGTAEPEFKVPFSVQPDEIGIYAYNDIRIGGWGVLFSGILCSAILLYLLCGTWKSAEVNIGLIFIMATIVINPGSWWARYAPQVALIPLLMAIPALGSAVSWQRISARFIFVLILLNSVLILKPNTDYFINVTQQLNRQIGAIVAACGKGVYEISGTEGYHFEPVLEKNGITITYPEKDITRTYPDNTLFPVENDFMPIKKFFLHKEGCIKTPNAY